MIFLDPQQIIQKWNHLIKLDWQLCKEGLNSPSITAVFFFLLLFVSILESRGFFYPEKAEKLLLKYRSSNLFFFKKSVSYFMKVGLFWLWWLLHYICSRFLLKLLIMDFFSLQPQMFSNLCFPQKIWVTLKRAAGFYNVCTSFKLFCSFNYFCVFFLCADNINKLISFFF